MPNTALRIDHVRKEFVLGQIGGGTLRRDLESWFARLRGREDPNRKLNAPGLSGKNERFVALDDVCMEVNEGDALGLIGHNGAGKSTLLKLIARITAPTAGKIYERGRVASMLEVGTGFHPELTGRENIFLNGAILGMSRKETARKLDEIIDFSEIEQFIDTPVKRYSSGMYVKLAFAVAAHLEPEILICDEVLAVGDVRFQQKCLGKMGDVASGGRTVIYVSHNMRTIEQLCNRAVCLKKGTVEYDGNVTEAVAHYVGAAAGKGLSFDLNDQPRPKNVGAQARMNALRLTNTTTCQIDMGGDIEFELDWKAQADLSNVRMRAIVINSAEQPVGAAASPVFANPRNGDGMTHSFTLNTATLAPGEYRCRLVMYQAAGMGKNVNLDVVEDAFRFEVQENLLLTGGSSWQNRWWGNTALPDMEVRG